MKFTRTQMNGYILINRHHHGCPVADFGTAKTVGELIEKLKMVDLNSEWWSDETNILISKPFPGFSGYGIIGQGDD